MQVKIILCKLYYYIQAKNIIRKLNYYKRNKSALT